MLQRKRNYFVQQKREKQFLFFIKKIKNFQEVKKKFLKFPRRKKKYWRWVFYKIVDIKYRMLLRCQSLINFQVCLGWTNLRAPRIRLLFVYFFFFLFFLTYLLVRSFVRSFVCLCPLIFDAAFNLLSAFLLGWKIFSILLTLHYFIPNFLSLIKSI